MLNKRKLTLTVSLLLIVLGVFGSLALVKRSQDLRRSAALVKTTIRLSSTTISGAVDSTVSVGIFIDTPRKVSTAKVKLCYGDALTTDVASVTNVGPLTVENSKSISNNCLIISKRVEASATIDQLATGSFQFANVTFKIKKNGNLTISQTESLIAGDPVNGDVNIPIDEVVGATVIVGSGGVVAPTSSSMTFESSDLTSKKVNENLSVKLYLNTTKNFDAAEVNFCYGAKLLLVDSGIVRGADFTDIAKKTISNNCLSYAVLATRKSLTGKILLGTFTFKAVSSGSGRLVFDGQAFSNAVDGLMKVENTPSVNYTIFPAVAVCKTGDKQCVVINNKNIQQTCTSGNWGDNVNCDLGCDIATGKCVVINSAVGSSMTFESKDLTSKKVGETLGVDLYLTTNKNFDFCSVKFCYGDKLLLVDSGIVKGTEFTGIFKKTINSNCLEYAVLAVNKSLTGKVLLGTFSFKAVATGSGTLAFDSTIKNLFSKTYINKNELWTAENTPSVGYTINSVTPVCTDSNWSFVLSPTTCPASRQQTKTWTKVGTCTGGVTHLATETVTCTSTPTVSFFYGFRESNDNRRLTIGDIVNSGFTLNSNGKKIKSAKVTFCSTDLLKVNLNAIKMTGLFSNVISKKDLGNNCFEVVIESVVTDLPYGNIVDMFTVESQVMKYGTGTLSVLNSESYAIDSDGVKMISSASSGAYFGISALSGYEAIVNVKLAFAGVKNNNGRCAKDNWLVKLKMVNGAENTAIGGSLTGYPTQTTAVNSRGEIVYDFSVTVAGVSDAAVINRSAFFLTGPKHISVKYGENNQERWYPDLVGALSLAKGTNSYDFSEYPLLAGDVTGDTVGVPDGKIDGRDYSYIKNKAIVLVAAMADGTNLDGDVNGDCQVNSGDVSLMVDSLKEINGQTY